MLLLTVASFRLFLSVCSGLLTLAQRWQTPRTQQCYSRCRRCLHRCDCGSRSVQPSEPHAHQVMPHNHHQRRNPVVVRTSLELGARASDGGGFIAVEVTAEPVLGVPSPLSGGAPQAVMATATSPGQEPLVATTEAKDSMPLQVAPPLSADEDAATASTATWTAVAPRELSQPAQTSAPRPSGAALGVVGTTHSKERTATQQRGCVVALWRVVFLVATPAVHTGARDARCAAEQLLLDAYRTHARLHACAATRAHPRTHTPRACTCQHKCTHHPRCCRRCRVGILQRRGRRARARSGPRSGMLDAPPQLRSSGSCAPCHPCPCWSIPRHHRELSVRGRVCGLRGAWCADCSAYACA